MTQQTDGSSINGLSLTQSYFYDATSSAAGASSGSGGTSYSGTVQTGAVAGIAGTITNNGNGFFSVTAADNTVTQYQILGSTTDSNYLVFETAHAAGTNTGPYFILSSSGAVPPAGDLVYNSTNAYTPPVACYVEGTLILTDRGELPIETLKVGDLLVTASGAYRPVIWTGHRTIDCSSHPRPHEVLPFRIQAGSFSVSVPSRDLLISPGHAVSVTCLEPVFVSVGLLANGATIKQEAAQSVTYWHVELETHDVIIANGLASETYLDVGNRSAFEGEGSLISLFPNLDAGQDRSGYCLPCIEDGPIVHALREQLIRRAALLGWTACKTSASLKVSVGGQEADGVVTDVTIRVVLNADSQHLKLDSPAFRPQDQLAHATDQRSLGVCVKKLTLIGIRGEQADIPLDHGCLIGGFWPVEGEGSSHQRWTNGSGQIDLGQIEAGFEKAAILITASIAQDGWSASESASARKAA